MTNQLIMRHFFCSFNSSSIYFGLLQTYETHDLLIYFLPTSMQLRGTNNSFKLPKMPGRANAWPLPEEHACKAPHPGKLKTLCKQYVSFGSS